MEPQTMTLATLPPDLQLPVLQTRKAARHFGPDRPPPGLGRRKGCLNKITSDLKQGILRGAQNCGYDGRGLGGIDGFLLMCAQQHPKHYLALLGRILPTTMTPEAPRPPTTVNVLSVPVGVHLSRAQIEDMRQGKPLVLDPEQMAEMPAPAEPIEQAIVNISDGPPDFALQESEEATIRALTAEIRKLSQKLGIPVGV